MTKNLSHTHCQYNHSFFVPLFTLRKLHHIYFSSTYHQFCVCFSTYPLLFPFLIKVLHRFQRISKTLIFIYTKGFKDLSAAPTYSLNTFLLSVHCWLHNIKLAMQLRSCFEVTSHSRICTSMMMFLYFSYELSAKFLSMIINQLTANFKKQIELWGFITTKSNSFGFMKKIFVTK